jgi:hypothetical protein
VGLETRSATVRGEALYHSQPWYRAYMSALFESNTALIAVRIVLAQRLIAARELELFNLRMASPELRRVVYYRCATTSTFSTHQKNISS